MKKLASIDIGTNSMRLLIAEHGEQLENRKKYIDITRMGHGVDSHGFINEETMERNLEALHQFIDLARREKVDDIYVMGTSALRDSKNRNEFVKKAKELTGVQVEVIGGKQEALLGFCGAIAGLKTSGYVLIIDIGGGSTEFMLGSREEGILFSESLNIGALRMTEKFVKNDKVSMEERNQIAEFVNRDMDSIIEFLEAYPITQLIGIGGTITTYSAIVQNMKTYDMNKIHNSTIKREQVSYLVDFMAGQTLEERKTVNGLQPKRADIIVAGGVILETILKKLHRDSITVSEYDNLEGLIYHNMKSGN